MIFGLNPTGIMMYTTVKRALKFVSDGSEER